MFFFCSCVWVVWVIAADCRPMQQSSVCPCSWRTSWTAEERQSLSVSMATEMTFHMMENKPKKKRRGLPFQTSQSLLLLFRIRSESSLCWEVSSCWWSSFRSSRRAGLEDVWVLRCSVRPVCTNSLWKSTGTETITETVRILLHLYVYLAFVNKY